MKAETQSAQLLVCGTCSGERFSWIVHQVQYGTVHRLPDSEPFEEGCKMGEIVGDDIQKNGLFCVACEEFRSYDDLVLADRTPENSGQTEQ